MNDKCAAGTGRFIEVMAHILELDINEMGTGMQNPRTLWQSAVRVPFLLNRK